ncbi:hypothetical protein I6F36_06420 [Bradyrhizobium sp. BRP19]|uniref:hypothetical protein n=1 Tax=Bradyrhizobium sp. BRP19 TaxID=2793823 RepID=UPI001CD7846E|nr:hypothetical protein [Bradyrhizobium sp. BRP19]MCA1546439.1 hypothetical protein [Bradyrhizobium sp. BRP19]
MAEQYPGVSITGYNSNPPPDDGTQTEANRVKWSTIKTKITDPVKTRTDDMDTALIAAFGKIDGGVTSTSISYTVLATDQGKLVRATSAGITITSPDATDVDAPFVFGLLNDSAGDIIFDGSGSQTVDGDADVTVPPGCGFRVRTDGSNWFSEGQNYTRTLVKPQGYLTLLSVATQPTSPIPASDQSAKTAVYYRPDSGNLIPIPDGTTFSVREFSELTLSLNNPNHVGNAIYDVFVFSDSGTLRIGTGPAWTTATAGAGARGSGAGSTELALLKGLLVNNVQITARNGSTTYTVAAKNGIYVGSLYIDGTAGQVSCHVTYGASRKWGVWNAYNKRRIFLKAGDATTSWIPANASNAHTVNNNSGNSLTTFAGLPEETLDLQYSSAAQAAVTGSTTMAIQVGIGFNSTSSFSGKTANFLFNNVTSGSTITVSQPLQAARFLSAPGIGINTVTALETTIGSNVNISVFGNEQHMLLSAEYWG